MFLTNMIAGVIFSLPGAGGMAEWSKAAVLKTVVPLARDRGFESYSLRQSPEGDPIDG
jgi:hypothetical protein